MEKLVYILRHGQTAYNKQNIIQGSGVDADLDDEGKAQALQFYQKYKDMPFELLICSALKRTYQSIEPFIETGIPLVRLSEINEINWGVHEGQKVNDDIAKNYDKLRTDWQEKKFDSRVDKGESAFELSARLDTFLSLLRKRPEKNILVCSHGRTLRALMCKLYDVGLEEMENYTFTNTSLCVFEVHKDHYKIQKDRDTSHLA